MSDELSTSELVEITGKKRAASQAVVLMRRGVPFHWLGKTLHVERAAAAMFRLLPQERLSRGVDFSRVR